MLLETPMEVCLYGEGVGPGIQKGGGGYSPTKTFVLFDIKIGHFWLQRDDVTTIANALGIPVAPHLGVMSLNEVVEFVRKGFLSTYGDFIAEGIIARPLVEMTNRRGERIITKLKHSDFAPYDPEKV
jgi:hypothetical protein